MQRLINSILPICLFFASIIYLSSCSIPQGTASNNQVNQNNSGDVMKLPSPEGIDLTDYLRRFSGVSINGSGPNAKIKIRGGDNSMNGTTSEPLYVVDGMVFNGSYSQLYSAININHIDKLIVYKDAADLAAWGSRGANGVIEIKLKKYEAR